MAEETSALPANRSMPASAVIPVLHYREVPAAATWLCKAFGFRERLRIGSHRIQLEIAGGGAVVVAQGSPALPKAGQQNHSIMVRVRNVDEHFAIAKAASATLLSEPTTYPYGERQYSAVDPDGHIWTFSQTLADTDPQIWGGTLISD